MAWSLQEVAYRTLSSLDDAGIQQWWLGALSASTSANVLSQSSSQRQFQGVKASGNPYSSAWFYTPKLLGQTHGSYAQSIPKLFYKHVANGQRNTLPLRLKTGKGNVFVQFEFPPYTSESGAAASGHRTASLCPSLKHKKLVTNYERKWKEIDTMRWKMPKNCYFLPDHFGMVRGCIRCGQIRISLV